MLSKQYLFISLLCIMQKTVYSTTDNLQPFTGLMRLNNHTGKTITIILSDEKKVLFTKKTHIFHTQEYDPQFFIILQNMSHFFKSHITIVDGIPTVSLLKRKKSNNDNQ